MDNSNSEPPWEQSFGFIPDISGRLFDMTGAVFPPAQVQLVGLEEESSEFVCRNTFDHPYPTTKIMWIPDTKGVYPDLLATSGDYLRIWRVRIQITVFYIGKS